MINNSSFQTAIYENSLLLDYNVVFLKKDGDNYEELYIERSEFDQEDGDINFIVSPEHSSITLQELFDRASILGASSDSYYYVREYLNPHVVIEGDSFTHLDTPIESFAIHSDTNELDSLSDNDHEVTQYSPNKALQPTPIRFAPRGCADLLPAVDHQLPQIARSGWLSLTLGYTK